jgi:hypothetical protein
MIGFVGSVWIMSITNVVAIIQSPHGTDNIVAVIVHVDVYWLIIYLRVYDLFTIVLIFDS